MKSTKKGMTLVEVLVAITVFSIVIFALFTTIVAMRKVVARQEEYVKIKMVCYDIDAYWDVYGRSKNPEESWDYKYFSGVLSENGQGYLTSDFKPTNNSQNSKYKIEFEVKGDGHLVIKKIESDDKTFIENFDCGESPKITEDNKNEEP